MKKISSLGAAFVLGIVSISAAGLMLGSAGLLPTSFLATAVASHPQPKLSYGLDGIVTAKFVPDIQSHSVTSSIFLNDSAGTIPLSVKSVRIFAYTGKSTDPHVVVKEIPISVTTRSGNNIFLTLPVSKLSEVSTSKSITVYAKITYTDGKQAPSTPITFIPTQAEPKLMLTLSKTSPKPSEKITVTASLPSYEAVKLPAGGSYSIGIYLDGSSKATASSGTINALSFSTTFMFSEPGSHPIKAIFYSKYPDKTIMINSDSTTITVLGTKPKPSSDFSFPIGGV